MFISPPFSLIFHIHDRSLINLYLSTSVNSFYASEKKKNRKQRILHQPTAPIYSSGFHPEPKSHLLLSLSLTHLPKVDTLTPSAGAVHIP